MKWENKWGFALRGRDWQTLIGEIESVKTALYFYKYPLIDETTVYDGLEIASLKDLVYFSKADEDEMPRMLVPVNWEEVKTYFLDTFI